MNERPHHLPGKNAELQKQIAEVEDKLKERKKGDPRFNLLLVAGTVFLMMGSTTFHVYQSMNRSFVHYTKTEEEELKAQHVADTLKANEKITKLEAAIRSLKVQPCSLASIKL